MALFHADDKIANAAKLIVGVASVTVDPTGLAATGLAADGYLSLKEIFKPVSPDAKKCAARIEKELKSGLTTPSFHMPAEGHALLPQMIEASFLSPGEIARIELANTAPQEKTSRLLEAMLAKMPREYARDAALCEAFCNLLRPIYTGLFADDTFACTLGPAIARETYTRLGEIAESLLALSQTYGSLAKSLDHMTQLRARELEALAFRFGLSPASGSDPADLLRLLELKAVDAQRFNLQIEAIDERTAGLGNLK
ncbi:MAG: hypothetical protein OEY05_10740, partial [Paracoccaceae bacterium]|nr:hypothetical protein [Paracoccaceae bacterium]